MNFASRILEACARHPERDAIRLPDGETIGYGKFARQVSGWQQCLHAAGIGRGDRVVVLLQPSIALYTLMTALLAAGVVPVLIERGMSRQRIAQSLRAASARDVIGEHAILKRWWLFPPLWRLRRHVVDRAGFGLHLLQPVTTTANPGCVTLTADAHGIITFTSGSTGAPKGADRTHGSLVAQHLAIREHWPDQDDDIDCTCFPVLVLHNLCCGITTVLPDADLAAPGNADPERIAAQLQREGITRLSAAPAFMTRLATHAQARQQQFPQVRSLVIGGATLPPALARDCLGVFPAAHARVVYGSTEAEPIADIDLPELVAEGEGGAGHLVGLPAQAATVAVVDPALPLHSEADVLHAQLQAGETGEILVAGAHVLRAYLDNPEATRASKIARADGTVWHRTGDAGYLDARGRLWLVGRLRDVVRVNGRPLHTFPLEKAVDALPGVSRCALLQDGDGKPVLVVAPAPLPFRPAELRAQLAAHGCTGVRIALIDTMPVDGRHNSKIDRPALQHLLARRRLRLLPEVTP